MRKYLKKYGLYVLIGAGLLTYGLTAKKTARVTLAKKALEASPYGLFSTATEQIEQGDLALALASAHQLKADMDLFPSKHTGALLYGINLVRIALLEKEVGTADGEKKAWEELEQFAGWAKGSPDSPFADDEARALFAQHLHQGVVTLRDYLEQRKKALK